MDEDFGGGLEVDFDEVIDDVGAAEQAEIVADVAPAGADAGQQAATTAAPQTPGGPGGQGAQDSDGGSPPPAEDSSADTIRALRAQLEAVSRQTQQFAPYFQAMQERTQQAAAAPPVSREAIENGTATPAQFLAYMEWQQAQNVATVEQRAREASLMQASESQARGMFSAETLGDPSLAYDEMRRRYLDPAYMTNPRLRAAVGEMVPESPAQGEYLVAALLQVVERNGGDLVKTARAILGRQSEVKDLTQRIQQAQSRQADRMVGGVRTGANVGGKSYDPNDPNAFSRMSDAEFERIALAAGGV